MTTEVDTPISLTRGQLNVAMQAVNGACFDGVRLYRESPTLLVLNDLHAFPTTDGDIFNKWAPAPGGTTPAHRARTLYVILGVTNGLVVSQVPTGIRG